MSVAAVEEIDENRRTLSAPARLQHLAKIMEAAIAIVDQGIDDDEEEGALATTNVRTSTTGAKRKPGKKKSGDLS